jgi:hypothetical protein
MKYQAIFFLIIIEFERTPVSFAGGNPKIPRYCVCVSGHLLIQ